MNDYSLKALHKDPVFWVLLYLSLPAILQVAYDVAQSVRAMQPYASEAGLEQLLSLPIVLYLGLGIQLPRKASIEAAAVQERAMIDNDHIRVEDPDMDEFINRTLSEDDE